MTTLKEKIADLIQPGMMQDEIADSILATFQVAERQPPKPRKDVAIVAMGASMHDFTTLSIVKGSAKKAAKGGEVWGINTIVGVIPCDRGFIMDDVKYILPQTAEAFRTRAKENAKKLQEEEDRIKFSVVTEYLEKNKTFAGNPVYKALSLYVEKRQAEEMIVKAEIEAAQHNNTDEMVRLAKDAKIPIYSTTAYDDFPNVVQYPLEFVQKKLGQGARWLDTTVAYALALAIAEDFTHISLWGCDFTYPDQHAAEMGHACVAQLIMTASYNGVKIEISSKSTLMGANLTPEERLYGFAPKMEQKK